MKTRTILLLSFLIILTKVSFGQVSASYYASTANSKIGVGYDFSKKVWGEVRVNGIADHSQVKPEAIMFYNFVNTEGHSLYIGVGGSFIESYNIMLPVGLRVNTSTVLKNTCVHIEVQPTFEGDRFAPSLCCSIGFRYFFGKKH